MLPPLLFLAEIFALSTTVCLVYAARERIGVAPFYLLVGLCEAFLFFVGKPANPIDAELFFVEPRGIYLIFLPTIMVSGVLVYVLEGTVAARRFIVGIIVLYTIHGVLDLSVQYHATHPPPGDVVVAGDLLWFDTHVRVASLGAMVCDFIVIIVVYQFLHNRLPRVPLAVPLFAALVVGMITDAAVFKLIRHGELSWSILYIGAKAQAGAAAGLPAAVLFALQLRRHPDAVRRGILDRHAFELVRLRERVAEMRQRLEERRAEYVYLKSTFSRYVSPDVVSAILEDPSKLKLGGELREVTILFADIKGYSTFSESLDPTMVIDMLNRYFARVGGVILEHRGMINEFEGDAVLAVFGAPLDVPEHASLAVTTALEMLDTVDTLNEEWEQDGTLERWRAAGIDRFAIRIGIHSGTVVAGNIGSEERKKYAVIGDTVNTASRVEGINKPLGTSLLLTTATRDALGHHPLADALVERGSHTVKGRSEAVQVFGVSREAAKELLAAADTAEAHVSRPALADKSPT